MTAQSYPVSPRNRVKRAPERGSYDHATAHAILDAAMLAHVSYVLEGQPFCTPTLIWREGEVLYWHGSSASRMTRAATGGPVCVTVTLTDAMALSRSGLEHSVNYRCVMVMGTATAITDPAQKARHLEVMMEQMFPGRWPQLRPMTAQELKATAILSLPLTEASAKISAAAPGESDPAEDRDWPVWAGNLPISLTMGTPEPAPDLAPGLALPDHAANYRFGKAPG